MRFEIRQKGGDRTVIACSDSAEEAVDFFYAALQSEVSTGLQIFEDGNLCSLERLTYLSFNDKLIAYKSSAL